MSWKFSVVLFTSARLVRSKPGVFSLCERPAPNEGPLPAELENVDEAAWLAWCRREDKAIRARLQQGDLDSMVNLLLYGTSFTKQPRISMEGEGLTEASKAGISARPRGRSGGGSAQSRRQRAPHLSPAASAKSGNQYGPSGNPKQTGVFILQNLQRVVQETEDAGRARRRAKAEPSRTTHRRSWTVRRCFAIEGFRSTPRIIPDFSIEQTLRDLKQRGVLREGQVARVAVIGPGLDFIDKNEDSAYDYYPEQTLQPFALYDSLVRLKLAKANDCIACRFSTSAPR